MAQFIQHQEPNFIDSYSYSDSDDWSSYEQADEYLYEQNQSTQKRCNTNQNNNKGESSSNSPLTVFLDLDNTLIYASLSPDDCYDFTVDVEDDERPGKMVTLYIKKRPHLEEFLSACASFAKLYLYTAAEKSYAEQVISYIDPLNEYFVECFYRDSCILTPTNKNVKDIYITQAKPEKIVLVDDSLDSFGGKTFLSNGIQIPAYVGNPRDRELDTLALVLKTLGEYDDIRPVLRSVNSKK